MAEGKPTEHCPTSQDIPKAGICSSSGCLTTDMLKFDSFASIRRQCRVDDNVAIFLQALLTKLETVIMLRREYGLEIIGTNSIMTSTQLAQVLAVIFPEEVPVEDSTQSSSETAAKPQEESTQSTASVENLPQPKPNALGCGADNHHSCPRYTFSYLDEVVNIASKDNYIRLISEIVWSFVIDKVLAHCGVIPDEFIDYPICWFDDGKFSTTWKFTNKTNPEDLTVVTVEPVRRKNRANTIVILYDQFVGGVRTKGSTNVDVFL